MDASKEALIRWLMQREQGRCAMINCANRLDPNNPYLDERAPRLLCGACYRIVYEMDNARLDL